MAEETLRIGELSRRVGVSPELLRAWERRYGLLQPSRTSGGFRLYSEADLGRIRRMQELLEQGIAASQAAALAKEAGPDRTTAEAGDRWPAEHAAAELTRALDAFDETAAHGALDRALMSFQLDTVMAELVLPYLRELGGRWERGEASVAQEHFASHLIRGRLLGLARGWDRGLGPKALLACPPQEQHDLALLILGLLLRSYGWRITFLGADTPLSTLHEAAEAIEPDLIVLSAIDEARFDTTAAALGALADRWQVSIAGPGASSAVADRLGVHRLDADPVRAAADIAGRP